MWNLIRIIVVALALVGFVGQTTARAMPMAMVAAPEAKALAEQTAPVMMDCADMTGMSDMAKAPTPQSPADGACTGLTADCVGKMGCATVAITGPPSLGVSAPVAYESVTFAVIDRTREGLAAALPYHPPKRPA